jgi:CRISPR-associated protein Cmr4
MPETAALFIHALTGVHAGSGTALGTVDLPVQRERHSQWPTIPGSTLKGILRDACRRNGGSDDVWRAAFGPETSAAHEHAGAVSVTDARILAFPVRSLHGVFAWTTCPAVLARLGRDMRLVGIEPPQAPHAGKPGEFLAPDSSPLLLGKDQALLEEFEFRRTGAPGDAPGWLARQATDDQGTRERIASHLAVLHDDDFTHFTRHATEIVARVGLNYETKTVKEGALFYEEFVPAETIFYALVFAEDSRRTGVTDKADQMLAYVAKNLFGTLQIGGDATIGKGLCAVRLVRAGGNGGKR